MEQGNKTHETREAGVKKKLTKQDMERLYTQIKEETDSELSERLAYFENQPVFDAHWLVPSLRKGDWIGIGIVICICITCLFVGVYVMIPWLYG